MTVHQGRHRRQLGPHQLPEDLLVRLQAQHRGAVVICTGTAEKRGRGPRKPQPLTTATLVPPEP